MINIITKIKEVAISRLGILVFAVFACITTHLRAQETKDLLKKEADKDWELLVKALPLVTSKEEKETYEKSASILGLKRFEDERYVPSAPYLRVLKASSQ